MLFRSQTLHGKTPLGVAHVAKRYGKPVIGIAGCLSPDAEVVHEHGIDTVFSVLSQVCTEEEALCNATENVRITSRNIASTLKLGMDLTTPGASLTGLRLLDSTADPSRCSG